MRKWKGATPTVPRGIIRDDSIGVGAMVAVLDLDTDKHFHIAKVMAIKGTTTTLWYAATKGKVLKTAVWKFMYNSPSNWGQGFTYAKPNLLNSDDFRFTGDIAKMWHSTCSISPKVIKRPFFGFTGFSL